MFEGFTPEAIDFLWGIRFNNNREWFQEHKKAYETSLYRPMQALAEEVKNLFSLDGAILKTARIYRDVRYSSVPYKESLWFVIRPDEVYWNEHPSLYFQIDPEGGSLGFIHYAPPARIMTMHRRKLLEKPEKFVSMMDQLLEDGQFQDRSVRYKRLKEGGRPEIEPWYQLKNCFLEEHMDPGPDLFSPDLPQHLTDAFTRLTPLYEYFRKLEQSA